MSDSYRLEEDTSTRRVLYLGALLLIVVPLLQAGSQLLPVQLGNIQWRIQAANVLSSVLLLPFLGILLMHFVARVTGNAAFSKSLGVISGATSLLLILSSALLALDALQFKKIVNSQMMSAFNVTIVKVFLVCGLFTVAFGLLALSGLKTKKRPEFQNKKVDKGLGLIVGQEKT